MEETQSVTKAEPTPPQGGGERPERFWQPFAPLRGEADRLSDSFWRGMDTAGAPRRVEAEPFRRLESGFGLAMPAIDLAETEKEFRVKAEPPGMDAGDVHPALSGDVLTIKRAKKDERAETTEDDLLAERRFGSPPTTTRRSGNSSPMPWGASATRG